MGECPDWYPLIRAARYLRVAPWDLLEQPIMWWQWAATAEAAEAKASAEKQKRNQRRSGRQTMGQPRSGVGKRR